jgi:DNA repair protein RecO (recombination protein O)
VPTLVTTNALVLNRRPWSESSQIVCLISPDLGKLRAVARGARKVPSELGPAVEPITESQFVLSRSPRSDLAHVRAADVLEYFSGVKRSFVKVALASALCELVDRVVPEEVPQEGMYGRVRAALAGMEGAHERTAVNWLWRAAYELAGDIGYAMQFERCVRCGSESRPHPVFSAGEGGPVCGNCRGEAQLPWTPETQEVLRWIATAPLDQIPLRQIPKAQNRGIRTLFEEYFRWHIPNFDRLRWLDMLTITPPWSSPERQPKGGPPGLSG